MSFIEAIVVIGVIALALPTLFAVFFLILQQQIHSAKLLDVKKQGLFVSNIITTTIRQNATGIYTTYEDPTSSVCSSSAQGSHTYPSAFPLYFTDTNSNWFYFDSTNNTIASASSLFASPLYLTSSTALIQPSSVTYGCSATGYGSPIVTLNYSVCYHSSGTASGSCDSGADAARLPFQVTVSLLPYK